MGHWQKQKEAVLDTAQELNRKGLVTSTSGNVSVRLDRTGGQQMLAITPSQRTYKNLASEDIIVMDFEGETIEGTLMPSSESALHLAIYKARLDVHAVLHTHSIFASVAAVAGLDIPPLVDELVVQVGGSVRVADYAFPGTEELGVRILEAMESRNAVLLRNHGLVAVGFDLVQALQVCELVERAAQIFVYTKILNRTNLLPPDIVEIERELFLMRQHTLSNFNRSE